MNNILPGYLKAGHEVAIVSPSFSIDAQKLYAAVSFLDKWGLKARIGRYAAATSGPFAGTDEERLSDLQEATNDPSIKAVFCARGGYGLSKIIDKTDFSALTRSPKWYVGFSDVTALHLWLTGMEGIISLHADMPLHYNDPEKTEDTFVTLRKALFGEPYTIDWTGLIFRAGDVAGEITGGNLSLVCCMMGTPAEVETEGRILFLEDTGDYIYQLDRMLMSLKLAGKLRNLSALLIGGMSELKDTKKPWGKSVEDTIYEIVKEYDYPVFFGFPAGHINDNRAIYIGRKASIKVNDNKASLSFV
ncbi:MAG TPA: LD-carboxypeptidase [Bacteroidales bacterium]|nr:LD-carboxypeptidase [Bacteroidales bacterium]